MTQRDDTAQKAFKSIKNLSINFGRMIDGTNNDFWRSGNVEGGTFYFILRNQTNLIELTVLFLVKLFGENELQDKDLQTNA